METVASTDGTTIAFDVTGEGPAVVVVSGALQARHSNGALAQLLEPNFTVLSYDRRGRGDSGDTPPYAVQREVEDLLAVIGAAGGSAYAFGSSSGGNLALRALVAGAGITKLALWEPNFVVNDGRPPLPDDYVEHLNQLVASDRRGDAIEYFMTTAVGMPAEFVAPMRALPFWPGMEAVAHTLAYDGAVVGDSMSGKPPAGQPWDSITVPTLVLEGGQSPWLVDGARALAEALPSAEVQRLEGQSHDVAADALAPALIRFFS